MANSYLKRFAEWGIGLRQSLARKLIYSLFADEIVGSQKLFISNVAHELRTPLSIIKTTSEVLLLDPDLSRDARRAFVEIIQELNRTSEIINNLVTLNTLERPERMAVQNLDLTAIAEEAVKRLRPLARERGVKVRLYAGAGAIAIGNRAGLETVCFNIIKNAIAFTSIDSTGMVRVRVVRGDKTVSLVVEDEGVGMTREEVAHVFEPFYRADVSRNRAVSQSGSGLGLTIVHELVRAHGGTIAIESKKRRGTTVTVALPRGGFIGATGTTRYTDARFAQSESGAHEPHSGRRDISESDEVNRDIPGA